MRTIIVALAIGAAVFMLRDFLFHERNLDDRKKYWEKEISISLKPGSSKEELLAFANTHRQKLHCYQNYKYEDQCGFNDSESSGGTSSHPLQLAVIFAIKDDKLVSHQLLPTPADAPGKL